MLPRKNIRKSIACVGSGHASLTSDANIAKNHDADADDNSEDTSCRVGIVGQDLLVVLHSSHEARGSNFILNRRADSTSKLDYCEQSTLEATC